jgi:hypothetical protein
MGLCVASLWAFPVLAQEVSDPEVEGLIAPALVTDTGLALARRQIGEGDLLGAAGTLERVLFVHPDFVPARLLYASLLCQLDDDTGAQVELSLLDGQTIPEEAWAEVARACPAVQRPQAETAFWKSTTAEETASTGGGR